jgi:hypothetical protein
MINIAMIPVTNEPMEGEVFDVQDHARRTSTTWTGRHGEMISSEHSFKNHQTETETGRFDQLDDRPGRTGRKTELADRFKTEPAGSVLFCPITPADAKNLYFFVFSKSLTLLNPDRML